MPVQYYQKKFIAFRGLSSNFASNIKRIYVNLSTSIPSEMIRKP